MKSFRNRALFVLAALAACAALHAALGPWVETLARETGLRAIFFRPMALPAGTIDGRRPPSETRPELARRIAAAPTDATLYRLRASEDELALDFTAADADWKTYAERSGDRIPLADYFHRRLRPAEEIATLDLIATPASFERAIAESRAQLLPVDPQFRAWIAHEPANRDLRKRFIHSLTDRAQYADAANELAAYRRDFPDDRSAWQEEMTLARRQGGVDAATAVFDKSFDPAMSPESVKPYFDLLRQENRLRDFLALARSRAAAQPEALEPAARLYHYFQYEQNAAAARRALLEYGARKQSWNAGELYSTAQLLERVQEWDQAARQYYALYTLPSAGTSAHRHGLAGLAGVLLAAPEQPIRFGAGDLSLYKDIATMDAHPGFLNGVLSLLLNTTWPRGKYDEQNRNSVAYFHRARASELLRAFDAQFPQAPEAPALHAHLIEAYAGYAEDDGVEGAGREFLAAYPRAAERTHVALLMADAFARQDKPTEELAVYAQLLRETRAPECTQVLDRYIARLVSLQRSTDALAVYRAEIARAPADPALYEKLSAFLEQHNLSAEIENVYRQAAAQFHGTSWDEKLARWCLRQKRVNDFSTLTSRVAQLFTGTELEHYFNSVVHPTQLEPQLYLQLNLYAHQRFPDDLHFVRNLLTAYRAKGTADQAAYMQLLRAYWFHDDALRTAFFEALARTGKLDGELASARTADARTNPAAAQFVAEGEAWRGHFETAAPLLRSLAAEFPGDGATVLRAATLERSLGRTESALALARHLSDAAPRDREALARSGDILAGRDLLARARPFWNRMMETEPGKPEGYLEAATVFWDYCQFDDALRVVSTARMRLAQPALYAYEAGAIHEGRRDDRAAIQEYLKGWDNESARARLIHMAELPSHRAAVDAGTRAAPVRVRAAIFEAEKRESDLRALLESRAAAATDRAELEFIQTTAADHGLIPIEQLALERQSAVNRDPVESVRLRLALMRLSEARSDVPAARRTIETLYRDNPATLGVVRATVDFYWRHQLPDAAIATLATAAARSNDFYRRQFTFEAARKSTEARQFDRARQFLVPLLAAQPYDGDLLAAMADTYAASRDDRGLREFYRATIDAMKQAPLAPADREDRIAALRRGLIPALARLDQPWDAVDQYIQLLNHYPEDEGLAREAARFATRHNLAPRLAAYYAKACTDSPKDARWPLVLARLQTHFENFDAAIAAYTAAVAIRPDRTDLYQHRAELETRLVRFAAAAESYRKLWALNYQNPTWLEKAAEMEARQGHSAEAVATLRKAWLEGRQERAGILLNVAQRLDEWGLVREAGDFAERAAHFDLSHENIAAYARIVTRLRHTDPVLAELKDREDALFAMAAAVGEYFTPEEKSTFEAALAKAAGDRPDDQWGRVAYTAGIYDLEVRWAAARLAHAQYSDYTMTELERRRMRFAEWGRLLENGSDALRSDAADAYATAGDLDGFTRVFDRLTADQRQYGLSLWRKIAQDDPWKLLPFAARRDAAADLAIESGDPKLALAAVAARGRTLPPLWNRAYTALTSLYYWSSAPDATETFRQLLGAETIGEQLGRRVDRTQQLAGSTWFYYGARYGEYLAMKGRTASADFLPASLEADPSNAAAYAALGDWHVERGNAPAAREAFEHAVELDPTRGAPHDALALVLWEQGHHDEAIAEWKLSIAAFEAQQNRPNLRPEFWVEAPRAIVHIGEHKLAAELGPAVESLLRAYMARHAGYRSRDLVANAAKYRLIDFGHQPIEVLDQLSGNTEFTPAERMAMFRRMIYLAPSNHWQLPWWHEQLAGLLFDGGNLAGAQQELASVPKEQIGPKLALRIAAKTGELDRTLDRFNPYQLQSAATNLENRGEHALSERVLEFVYTRELDGGSFSASSFLGLAELRLKQGNLSGALSLLKRMQLLTPEPFADLMPAAKLLTRYNHPSEAAEFIKTRVAAVPWDAEARLELRQNLSALAAGPNVPYRVRASAASLGGAGGTGELALLARGHITPAEAAHPYYYDARLAAAQSADAPTRVRLLMDALAIRPDATEPLLPLFHATFETHQYQIAHEAAERLRPDPLDPALARQLAFVDERFAEEDRGTLSLQDARKGQPASVQQALDREIAALNRRADLRARNAARAPQVSSGIEQSRLVRPRIEQ